MEREKRILVKNLPPPPPNSKYIVFLSKMPPSEPNETQERFQVIEPSQLGSTNNRRREGEGGEESQDDQSPSSSPEENPEEGDHQRGSKRKSCNFKDRERFYYYSAIIEARGRLGIEYSLNRPYKYVSEPLWQEAKRILENNFEIHKIPPENYPRNIKSLRELMHSSMKHATTDHQKRTGRPKIIDNFEERTRRYLEENLSLRQIKAAFRRDYNETIAVSTLSRIAHKLKMVRPKCYHGTNKPKTPRKSKSSTP